MIMLLFLAFAFALLVGFSGASLVLGVVVAFCVMAVLPQLPISGSVTMPTLDSGKRLVRYTWNVLVFLFDFLWDLILSNTVLALDVWIPKDYYRPRLLEVPIADLTDLQIAFLAMRISLTPGTLSVDVTADRQHLLVHAMYPKCDGQDANYLRRPIDILRREV
ncbi:MAG: Na+/H+ antiporter subunit E [Candidatus Sumerlaeia bacterium]|nr:Na+/H+ antiporter subunit E [Candidatus Sumerlaeia bacterium]